MNAPCSHPSPDIYLATYSFRLPVFAAYDSAPGPLFRAASFVWNNSLFVVGGHTDEPFTVTGKVWRADIQGFNEAPEGLWRPVNTTTNDTVQGDVVHNEKYGHTATVLVTEDSNPTEVCAPPAYGHSAAMNSFDCVCCKWRVCHTRGDESFRSKKDALQG